MKNKRGNPNQEKVIAELRRKGYIVSIWRNQIHVKGITQSPLIPAYKAFPGETYGMSIAEAKALLSSQTTSGFDKPKA